MEKMLPEHMAKMHPKYRVIFEFMNEYGDLYPEIERSFLKKHLLTDMNLAEKDKEVLSVVVQVYKFLRICPEATKIYDDHFDEIKKHFSIDGNICEIGGGRLPSFANMVAEEQLKTGKGTITVYDPGLVFLEPIHLNISLHKDYFTKDTAVSNYDLLVGIHPCEATEIIIDSAFKNDKDFYVAMCNCKHDGFNSPKVYQEHVIDHAKELANQYNREIEVTSLDRSTYNYPIIYSKKRTR